MFRISFTKIIEIQNYPFLQSMEVARSINTAEETLGIVCLVYSTVDELCQCVRMGTQISEQIGPSVQNLFGMENLDLLHDWLSGLR